MDTTLQDPLVGRLLDDRYQVESRVARGGMATVYLAEDRRLGRDVAVKVMHAHLGDDEVFRTRFIREAHAAARLSHPNVVQVFDQGADGDLLYLAMEYLPGRTLRQVLGERGVLTPREALTVLEPVLSALAAAHKAGIVHRDVKPENVILTDDGRVKVADFGLARVVTTSVTATGMLMGTVAYLAPELVARGIADARADVYAAGIMFFELLTGRQPFTGDLPDQVAYRHVHEDVPLPSSLVPALPSQLDDLVALATARDPDERPTDAADFLALVRGVHAALPGAALDARPPRPVGQASGRPATSGTDDDEGMATELVGHEIEPQPTRALPRGVRLGGPVRPLGSPRGRSLTRSAQLAGLPPEDAELVALVRRRHHRGRLALIAVLVLALLLAGIAWWFAAGPGAFTRTPSLRGLAVAEATKILQRGGLSGAVDQKTDERVPVGQVISTDPAGGQRIRKGGTVTLVVSRGPAMVTVPPLTGLTVDQARAALTKALLTLGKQNPGWDDTARKGTVLSSAPGSGRSVANGSPVTVVVSQGPMPVTMPNLVNETRDQAAGTLQGLHLVPDITQQFSDTVPAGTVISQKPAPDTALVHGDHVQLVLSQGPQLVQVPNVVGHRKKGATDELKRLGFQVQYNQVLGGVLGLVQGQNPPPGSMAPNGSTITLTIV